MFWGKQLGPIRLHVYQTILLWRKPFLKQLHYFLPKFLWSMILGVGRLQYLMIKMGVQKRVWLTPPHKKNKIIKTSFRKWSAVYTTVERISNESWNLTYLEPAGSNFMALLTAEFCACHHHSPLTVQAPNFCASCVSKECLVAWSTHAHQQKLPANPWNTLDLSTEFPASVECRFFAYGKQSHGIGPRWLLNVDN